MNFWNLFKNNDSAAKEHVSGLHKKITELLPKHTENEHIAIACMSGLMARVAYVDFELHKNELEDMKKAIKQWSNFSDEEAVAIVSIATSEVKELAGVENAKYCHPLNDHFNNDEKYCLLETLFQVASSDGEVNSKEEEEIRLITKGLLLEHKHYISARATVVKYLKSLKAH